MKMYLFAAAVSSLIAAPAAAETFSGPYAGVEVGLDNYEIQGEDLVADGDAFDGLSANGIMGGIFVGYDLPLGRAFVGVEANANLSDASLTYSDGVDTLSVKAKESYGVTARLGAMLNDSTGLYARAGWANTKFRAEVSGDAASDHDDALVLGAGVETRVGAGSLRAEYVRADYSDEVKNNRVALGYAFRF